MKTIKKLGIWMCHSSFHLVEFAHELPDELLKKEIELPENISTNDATMLNEAFHLQTESFKKLAVAVEKYNEVVLFGPVDAKIEFFNFLNSDERFKHIKIEIKQTQDMGIDQQQSYVENYFSQKAKS